MDTGRSFRVFDDRGYVGVLISQPKLTEPGSAKLIRLQDGREIQVRAEDLKARPDGSFQLRGTANGNSEHAATPEPQMPAAAAAAPDPNTSAAQAPPASSDGFGTGQFFENNYQIERVPVGRILTEPATQRQEGDTLILPVVEEVVVCEKKMMLKEEVRITMRRQPVREIRQVPGETITKRA